MLPENVMKLLANPIRVSILEWLKKPHESFSGYSQLYDFDVYGVCASLIQDKAGLSQPATSICLKSLQEIGLIKSQKVGKWTYYRRDEPGIDNVIKLINDEISKI